MGDDIKLLTSRVFKNFYLRASESFWISLLVLAVIAIVGIPFIQYLQDLVRNYPYLPTLNYLWIELDKNLTNVDFVFILLFVLIFLALGLLYKQYTKTRVIYDDFNHDLRKWSIPLNSAWTIQKSDDSVGKKLSVTNSSFPGIMKGAYGWFDYEFVFLAKIEKEVPPGRANISFVVRSENNLNGVMFQITENQIRPHLLYNGTYILDDENIEQLPTILKPGIWIKIKTIIKGNNVEIWIEGFKLQYKIPTNSYFVENRLLTSDTKMSELKNSDNRRRKLVDSLLNLSDQLKGNKTPSELEELNKRVDTLWQQLSQFTRVALDFQKGSVGFRESGEEQTYFRKVSVKRID